MPSYCTLVYDGSSQPAHLSQVFRFKGVSFDHGKEVSVSPELAGHLVATCEKGAFTVKDGIPATWTPGTASAKLAVRKAASNAKAFHQDPAGALANVATLSADMLKATVADIDAGKMDASLGDLAVWAKLGGKVEIANAAARRAESLRLKA